MKFNSKGNYYPIIWSNEFWLLNEDLTIINDTVESLPLHLQFEPISLLRFSLYTQMEESFTVQKVKHFWN